MTKTFVLAAAIKTDSQNLIVPGMLYLIVKTDQGYCVITMDHRQTFTVTGAQFRELTEVSVADYYQFVPKA